MLSGLSLQTTTSASLAAFTASSIAQSFVNLDRQARKTHVLRALQMVRADISVVEDVLAERAGNRIQHEAVERVRRGPKRVPGGPQFGRPVSPFVPGVRMGNSLEVELANRPLCICRNRDDEADGGDEDESIGHDLGSPGWITARVLQQVLSERT